MIANTETYEDNNFEIKWIVLDSPEFGELYSNDGLSDNDFALGDDFPAKALKFAAEDLALSVDRIRSSDGGATLSGSGGEDEVLTTRSNAAIRGSAGNDRLTGGGGNDRIDGLAGHDKIRGGGGNDTLNGGAGHDSVRGDAGDDMIFGGGGHDRIRGGGGSDTLFGGGGGDKITGGAGRDRIRGDAGADTLFGDGGSDRIWGGGGNDTINGGAGNDTLTGNGGTDTFIFAGSFGHDVITDFHAFNGAEDIDLRGVTTITSWADLSANHMSQVGNDVLISDQLGNTIRLAGVTLASLDASDFIF